MSNHPTTQFIELKATWAGLLPAMLATYERPAIRAELERMARIADATQTMREANAEAVRELNAARAQIAAQAQTIASLESELRGAERILADARLKWGDCIKARDSLRASHARLLEEIKGLMQAYSIADAEASAAIAEADAIK